jgi:hypothetical protein
MVFDVTFNNISVISRRSVLLAEETGVPGLNYRPAARHFQTYMQVVIGTYCRGSYKSNYHTIMNTPAPNEECAKDLFV